MRMALISTFLSFSILTPSPAQPASTTSSQAAQLLQAALKALTGGAVVSDVTLSGPVQYIAGSDDETGTAKFESVAAGAIRTELDLPSGMRVELRNVAAAAQAGSWSGPDGVSHSIAQHNLLTELSWFYPTIAISRGLAETGAVETYGGPDTFNSASVQHVAISQPLSGASVASATVAQLTQLDLFLDPTTSLPVGMSFNVHPDDDALINIPVQILFSDYRMVNGVQIPFHVQRLFNSQLVLDLQFNDAVVNSGLTVSSVGAL